ncbi:MAG: hypothetical protein ABI638_13645 [Ignavibacteriota bacterium]
MKNSLLLAVVLLLITSACKESVTEPPLTNGESDFFPATKGNYYLYNVSVFDTNGLVQSGNRKSSFTGDTLLLATPYQIKVDTIQLDNIQSLTNTYFRKSSTGIFNYVGIDTTGFSGLVPDSLRGGYSFSSEYRLIYQPLSINQTWPVYKINVDLLYIEFELFGINASVISKDSITLTFRNLNVTKEVYKIRYTARLTTSLTEPPIIFEAYAWIADGIGFIKWEGDSELINFFAGKNVYPSNTTVLEELYSYKIN